MNFHDSNYFTTYRIPSLFLHNKNGSLISNIHIVTIAHYNYVNVKWIKWTFAWHKVRKYVISY